jgi:hypothetical protein
LADLLQEASIVEQQYKQGLDYKKQMGFLTKWPECERFKAGDQWPAPTEKTKNLPRPVFNIIEQIESHKVASVMNENIKMVFSPEEILAEDEQMFMLADEAGERFTQFADATWERVKQDELNEEALEDGANRGTGFWHYYWDYEKQGGMALKWVGEMCGETIDPMDIFFGNPQQKNVQKQPYIIITSRETIENIRAEAEANKISKETIAMIRPDKDTEDQGYDMAKHELADSEKATVKTKYWKDKKTGTVWFTKVCSGVVFKTKVDTNMKRYPIAAMPWKRRKRSIYGVGDTEGLIPNQKGINLLMALQLLNAQVTGFPKLMVKKDFIRQQITNTIGEILIDTSPPGQWSAQYMTPGNMAPHTPMLVEKYIEYTKETSGANENALGEKTTSDLNATAIMLLQKAAGVPIESIKRRFYRAMEDIGLIWMEFFKVKYNTERMVTVQDEDGNDMTVPFNGSKYQDVELNLKIDIGPSSSYSETLMMSSLDKFLEGQYITFEDYLDFAPKNVVPFKDRLKKKLEQRAQQMQMDQAANFEQMLSLLPPDEQLAFRNAPPDVQQRIMMQMQQGAQQPQGGTANGMPQMQPVGTGG